MAFLSKSFFKRFLPALILILGLICYGLLALFKPRPQPRPVVVKPLIVQAAVLKKGRYRPNLLLYATVQSTQHATLSARVSSVVDRILVRDGDRVHQGQLLVQLDSADLKLAVKRARADLIDIRAKRGLQQVSLQSEKAALLKQKSALRIVQRGLNRLVILSQKQFLSQDRLDKEKLSLKQQELAVSAAQRQVDTLESQLQQSQATLMRVDAQLKMAENQLRYSRVTAPFSGVITKMEAAKGEHVNVGRALLDIMSSADVEVRALIPSDQLVQLSRAQRSRLTATALLSNKHYALSFVRLAGRIRLGQLGREGVFKVNQASFPAVKGQVFHVVLSLLPRDNSFVLPLSALYGNNKIYLVKDGRLQKTRVTLLGRQYIDVNTTRFVFSNLGLKTGDRVLTTALPNAINGLAVTTKAIMP